ncbi:MAG: hypothetical protein GKR97_11975 [Rhizobiaceae bacterium]|nr:hypothetical protein [Rhizobiaceae bacterium]
MAELKFLPIMLSFLLVLPAEAAEWTAKKASGFKSPGQGHKAKGGLPDGYEANAASGDIAKAWYVQPTRRYRHGILGDDIEAGGLKVMLRNGKTAEVSLTKSLVFEDRTPRLLDLDGDGKNEVITLMSSNSKGAAIAVFGSSDGQLELIDQTPFIGRSNRWRNVAGIADYNGDGLLEIAEVVTPHIGGTLKFWTWKNRRLKLAGSKRSFSNHAIGSREQRLSATADFNGDGRVDIAVPGSNRRSVRIMGFVDAGGGNRKLKEIANVLCRRWFRDLYWWSGETETQC